MDPIPGFTLLFFSSQAPSTPPRRCMYRHADDWAHLFKSLPHLSPQVLQIAAHDHLDWMCTYSYEEAYAGHRRMHVTIKVSGSWSCLEKGHDCVGTVGCKTHHPMDWHIASGRFEQPAVKNEQKAAAPLVHNSEQSSWHFQHQVWKQASKHSTAYGNLKCLSLKSMCE